MVNSEVSRIRALAATRSEVCLFLVFFIFDDTPSEICMVLKNGVCRSSSEALFSAEPTFVEKKSSPNEPSNPNFPPLELRFRPPRAEFYDFRVRISLYSIVFSGRTPPDTQEIRTFPKRAVARKRSAFLQ